MPYIVRHNRRYTVTEDQFREMQGNALDGGRTLRSRHADIQARLGRGEIPTPPIWTEEDEQREQLRWDAMERVANMRATTPFFAQEYKKPWDKGPEMPSQEFPPLTFPLVPETDGGGVKKLYKTRYAELEKMYCQLYDKAAKWDRATEFFKKENSKLVQQTQEAIMKLQDLEARAVDSELVTKRMEQVARELGLTTVMKGRGTMADKLNSFFGALLTRVRCEPIEDELAD